MNNPKLSIIIPAFNEEKRLPSTLEQVFSFVQNQTYDSEVLIIENGSSDRTFEVAKEYADKHPRCLAIRNKVRGKGLAVRTGMLRATGQYRFMCDADLSMPITEINRFLPPFLDNFDVAIASREAPGSVRYNEPAYRHWGGRGTNLIIRVMALPGLHDTQCGFKMFQSDVVEDIFHYQTIKNWSFDIELLYIARMRGYRITEIPIPWYFNAETKLNPFRDAIKMVLDILTIRRNARTGLYDPEKIT